MINSKLANIETFNISKNMPTCYLNEASIRVYCNLLFKLEAFIYTLYDYALVFANLSSSSNINYWHQSFTIRMSINSSCNLYFIIIITCCSKTRHNLLFLTAFDPMRLDTSFSIWFYHKKKCC